MDPVNFSNMFFGNKSSTTTPRGSDVSLRGSHNSLRLESVGDEVILEFIRNNLS